MNEAELLFSRVLNCQRASLYLNKDKFLDRDEVDFINAALKRRIKGEPIQHILGATEFMGLEFKVNGNALIPRPETEILVEAAIRYAKDDPAERILDLGTGSGCIAVSLGKHLRNSRIDASDISGMALALAKDNAISNSVNINFIQSDLFAGGQLPVAGYDIIVSNPPYIAEGEIKGLQPELQYEPLIALSGGSDGLDFYRRIITQAPGYLKDNGLLIMEIGFGQQAKISGIFSRSKLFEITELIKDYNNIDRVIVARKAEKNG